MIIVLLVGALLSAMVAMTFLFCFGAQVKGETND